MVFSLSCMIYMNAFDLFVYCKSLFCYSLLKLLCGGLKLDDFIYYATNARQKDPQSIVVA